MAHTIPGVRLLDDAVADMTFLERCFFILLLLGAGCAALGLVFDVQDRVVVEIPRHTGALTEGVIGAPRFINPLLAVSDTDRDLTLLTYAGLLKPAPDGSLIPDLAKAYTISEDGLSYTFTLKDGLTFHDGTPLTADDVIFTIERAQNPDIKSPKRPNWEGVLAERIDSRTVTFTLSQVYVPFLENTTLGILPKHIWGGVPTDQFGLSQFNIEPVGAGPYTAVEIRRNASGIPESYELASFENYALGEPYIPTFSLSFYATDEARDTAYTKSTLDQFAAVSPHTADKVIREHGGAIATFPLPRVFGVFFNQNEAPLFTDSAVRQALDTALNKAAIVRTVLNGYGSALSGPLPHGSVSGRTASEDIVAQTVRIQEAQALLEEAGFERDLETNIYVKDEQPLSLTLTTRDTPELTLLAETLQKTWEELGTEVIIQIFDQTSITHEVIRPRQYEALLFGQVIGRARDPFAFWHSSQRNDPGLNIALYTNIEVDSILKKLRTTFDPDEVTTLEQIFTTTINDDVPAVFLYSPEFLYIIDERLRGITPGTITTPAERFLTIHQWHLDTERVLPFFTRTAR